MPIPVNRISIVCHVTLNLSAQIQCCWRSDQQDPGTTVGGTQLRPHTIVILILVDISSPRFLFQTGILLLLCVVMHNNVLFGVLLLLKVIIFHSSLEILLGHALCVMQS